MSLSVSPKKMVLRVIKTLNSKNIFSGKREKLDKNYEVFMNSLTYPYQSKLIVVHALNLPPQSPTNHNRRSTHKYRKHFYIKTKPYYKKTTIKPTKPLRSKSKPKPKFDLKNIACYKCGQKGHTSRFCQINTKLHEL